MSVQKIMELFGPEFDNVIPFCKKIDFLFEHHKTELNHVLQTTELLNKLLNSKFSEKKKNHLENLAELINTYLYDEEDQKNSDILPIYFSFREYVEDMTYMTGPVDTPFETYADISFAAIQLLKCLVEEKKIEKYKEDRRTKALYEKSEVRGFALNELGYHSYVYEFGVELYLDESIDQPKNVLYVLDLNPNLEYNYAYRYTKKPILRSPDKRFQSFIEHYKETLSNDQLLFDILDGPWGLKKYNRLLRLSAIVSRVLIAQRFCNKVYVKNVHPLYDFLQEYIFNSYASMFMNTWSFKYDNLDPIGAELCDLFRKFIAEKKTGEYKEDQRYKEFIKRYKPYVNQVRTLRKPYRKEDEKLLKE